MINLYYDYWIFIVKKLYRTFYERASIMFGKEKRANFAFCTGSILALTKDSFGYFFLIFYVTFGKTQRVSVRFWLT